MRRELDLVLRARWTWLVAAAAALLVGHGFVLAVDIFSAASRSAAASALQAQQMDPLAAIVRPTLGGVDLALSLLGPVVAARSLAIEKERRTYGPLCLASGSTARVVLSKSISTFFSCGLLLLPAIVCLALFRALGGHVDVLETAVALLGELLHLALVVAVGMAAAAWTSSVAQAVTVGIVVSLTSWAIDAAEGFAALAWLGGASSWSIEQRLAGFARGIVAVGSIFWLVVAFAAALALALVGATFDRMRTKIVRAAVLACVATALLLVVGRVRRAWDWTEERRASFPPGVVDGLRAIPSPLALDVYLDRDDSRRRQLESDVVTKLRLARPDVDVRFPLDAEGDVGEGARDADYGRIVLHVGGATRETRSTSRKELVTLVFETAARPQPDWAQPLYPGFPVVIEGGRRTTVAIVAYAIVPGAFVVAGLALGRRRRR